MNFYEINKFYNDINVIKSKIINKMKYLFNLNPNTIKKGNSFRKFCDVTGRKLFTLA